MIKGNVVEQKHTMRGWLVGQFFPAESPFRDDAVEIYYKTFPAGKSDDVLHMHPYGREYLIVLDGSVRMKIGNEEVLLDKGDYIAISNNTPDQIIEIIEPLTVMGVRYPSIPNNKVLLES